jgi:hypothetical protein
MKMRHGPLGAARNWLPARLGARLMAGIRTPQGACGHGGPRTLGRLVPGRRRRARASQTQYDG